MGHSKLTVDQYHMMYEYMQDLVGVSEAFQYLDGADETKSRPKQVFKDTVLAFEKINQSHSYIVEYMNDQEFFQTLLEEFHEVVLTFEKWAETKPTDVKVEVLSQQLIPSYENWKSKMQATIIPYIAH
ncbi:hypothetical protein [Halobacillus seohaensis]|uniref:DUF8042 domain-containing protein n=1 Tax=Halobacillus seohaensis TaxID=447421 RepID=A0ABW2EMD3_9BACI